MPDAYATALARARTYAIQLALGASRRQLLRTVVIPHVAGWTFAILPLAIRIGVVGEQAEPDHELGVVLHDDLELAPVDLHLSGREVFQAEHEPGLGFLRVRLEGPGLAKDQGNAQLLRARGAGGPCLRDVCAKILHREAAARAGCGTMRWERMSTTISRTFSSCAAVAKS